MANVVKPRGYAFFQNRGYQGLYGGLGAREIYEKKGLKKGEKIIDHMENSELAVNLFRATQTDEKIRRDQIKIPSGILKTERLTIYHSLYRWLISPHSTNGM